MNKQKQIKEIAKVLDECCNFYDENDTHLGNKCNSHDCEYWCDTNNLCCSYNKKEATALYEQGYRKIPKDSIVLTREEYEILKIKEKEKHWLKTCMTVWEKAKIEGGKETAEKILKWIKEHCDFVGFVLVETYFKEEFGVEVKE